jgi:hypothetical protein
MKVFEAFLNRASPRIAYFLGNKKDTQLGAVCLVYSNLSNLSVVSKQLVTAGSHQSVLECLTIRFGVLHTAMPQTRILWPLVE